MGVKRKGNPDWEPVISPSGRTVYRKRQSGGPANASGTSSSAVDDFGGNSQKTVNEETDDITEIIEGQTVDTYDWSPSGLDILNSEESGFTVKSMVEGVDGIDSAVVISESTGRIYGVTAATGWGSADVLSVHPLEEVSEVVPLMDIGSPADFIPDPELSESLSTFVSTQAPNYWDSSKGAAMLDCLSETTEDDQGRVMYQLTPSQERQAWGDPGPLGVYVDLWDNGHTQNAREYEYGVVYYDPALERGLLMVGRGSSESGSSPGEITVTPQGIRVNDPDGRHSWCDQDDTIRPLTLSGDHTRKLYRMA